MKNIKIFFLQCLRTVGIFHVFRAITRNRYLILCYHGFSLADEHEVFEKLFMRPETFERRLDLLGKWGFNFGSLDQFAAALANATRSHNFAVLTIDDGWYGTFAKARRRLNNLNTLNREEGAGLCAI